MEVEEAARRPACRPRHGLGDCRAWLCLISTTRSGLYVSVLHELWVDTHVDPPLRRRGNALNEVVDRYALLTDPDRACACLSTQKYRTFTASYQRYFVSTKKSGRENCRGLAHARARGGSTSSQGPLDCGSTRAATCVRTRYAGALIQIFLNTRKFIQGLKSLICPKFRGMLAWSSKIWVGATADAVFFDDERRNGTPALLTEAEVQSKLGVHFVQVGHQGLDLSTLQRGIKEWRKRAE